MIKNINSHFQLLFLVSEVIFNYYFALTFMLVVYFETCKDVFFGYLFFIRPFKLFLHLLHTQAKFSVIRDFFI